jgi:hypothetical protein
MSRADEYEVQTEAHASAPGGRAAAGAPNARPELAPPPRRVKTSEDARLGATLARNCGCGTPFRGYSSVFSYVLGAGWLWDALGSSATTGAANTRIRRSMSSRIAVEALQDDNDDDDES